MSDYHHGDLRKALLEAAHVVLNAKGIHGLSLRALRRLAYLTQRRRIILNR